MPSEEAKSFWLDRVRNLEIDMLAPQHGALFRGDDVSRVLEWFDALPVALLVMGIGFSLGGPTGYAINPARDLGPRLMHAILPIPHKGESDWKYAWIPVLAPLLGGAMAAAAYLLINAFI